MIQALQSGGLAVVAVFALFFWLAFWWGKFLREADLISPDVTRAAFYFAIGGSVPIGVLLGIAAWAQGAK